VNAILSAKVTDEIVIDFLALFPTDFVLQYKNKFVVNFETNFSIFKMKFIWAMKVVLTGGSTI
jgi:hypothetical protein